jgi:hypothetical protein
MFVLTFPRNIMVFLTNHRAAQKSLAHKRAPLNVIWGV